MHEAHQHVVRTVLISLFTQGLGCAASLGTTPRAAEAFASLGVIAALFAACGGSVYAALGRRAVCGGVLTLWALRLSAYLFVRNRPPKVPLFSLAVSRTVWSAAAALPVVLLIASPQADDGFRYFEIVALSFSLVALALETVADVDKYHWHTCKTGPVITAGVWSLSRHANLAGEGMFHVSLCAACVRGSAYSAVSICVALAMVWHLAANDFGPVVCSERSRAVLLHRDAVYEEYARSTSVYFPIPPAAWRRMGVRARYVLFEREDWRRGAAISLIASATAGGM